jgi:2-methylcitrate dehydratase PrpD
MEYCIAKSLMDGKVTMRHFTDHEVQEEPWQALIPGIRFEHPDNWGHGAVDLVTEIVIRLKDGEIYSHRVDIPKGEPENPMTEEELLAKFTESSSSGFEKKEIDELIQIIQYLDKTTDLKAFCEILRGSRA